MINEKSLPPQAEGIFVWYIAKMNVRFHNSKTIAELRGADVIIGTLQDALDLIYNPELEGVDKIIIHEHNLTPDFFELKTGLAGDVLQKFVQYRVQVAIVGNFSTIESKSLTDFIRESNRGRHVFFAESVSDAIIRLL